MDYPTLILWTGPFPVQGVILVIYYYHILYISELNANSVDPDQTPRYDQGLHCLSMFFLSDIRLRCVALLLYTSPGDIYNSNVTH